jgi:hypothetical protein
VPILISLLGVVGMMSEKRRIDGEILAFSDTLASAKRDLSGVNALLIAAAQCRLT